MTERQASGRRHRTVRGLIIEGTATRLTRAGEELAGTAAGTRAAGPADLSGRAADRPYQSLLDDAMRLARRCGPFGPANWRVASPSS